jgi:HTH-type transcriptional regulator / antitoxin HipB
MAPGEIAKIVLYCRKQSGLSQQDLAKLAGVGKTVIFDIEKGKETVQLNTLLKILDVLNIRMKFETPFAQPTDNNP